VTFRWTCTNPGAWEGTDGTYASTIRRLRGDLLVSVRVADGRGVREISFYVFDDVVEAMRWAELAALEDLKLQLEGPPEG
jgi:hypothetical protein